MIFTTYLNKSDINKLNCFLRKPSQKVIGSSKSLKSISKSHLIVLQQKLSFSVSCIENNTPRKPNSHIQELKDKG